jgi:hypothetical protein
MWSTIETKHHPGLAIQHIGTADLVSSRPDNAAKIHRTAKRQSARVRNDPPDHLDAVGTLADLP